MASRNLPPSFFNANYHSAAQKLGYTHSSPADLYSEAYSNAGLHHLASHHTSLPQVTGYRTVCMFNVSPLASQPQG